MLPAWAWERLAVRLEQYGGRTEGTLAGRHVRAALEACHRDPGTDQALEGIGRRIIEALEALDGLDEDLSGQDRPQIGQVLARASELLNQGCQGLNRVPLKPDVAFLGVYGRLDLGVTFLSEINGALDQHGEEAIIAGVAGVKRLVEPARVELGQLQLAQIKAAEPAQAVSA